MKLILASQSPRRKTILSRLDIPFKIIVSNIDESIFTDIENPTDYAQKLALLKSKYISNKYIGHLVVGADTIVVLNSQVMGKPKNKKDAINMLKTLSGNTHRVITAVSIQCAHNGINHNFHEETKVTFRQISSEHINTYTNSTSPYDKAGSYGIQDWSAIFVDKINGCYDNVVGFPLSRFVFELEKIGINLNKIS